MVAKAAALASGLKNMSCACLDMQDLSCFPDASFDIVTCCYGYMFAEDRVMALKETRRVLKPHGVLIATYWINGVLEKI